MNRLLKSRILGFLLLIVFNHILSFSQPYHFTTKQLHSHNDYHQPFPFWDAYHHQFGSIEVDVFLQNNKLLVGHEKKELDSLKTIESLYLNPINDLINQQKITPFILLVDLKTEGVETLDKLVEVLRKYPAICQEKQVKITITGKQPNQNEFVKYPDWIWFDGNPLKTYTPTELAKISLMSADLKKFSSWNGKGIFTQKEWNILNELIEKTKQIYAKPLRFWNAPEGPNAWYQLMKLGVGFINTDHIAKSATFIKKLSQQSFSAVQQQSTYQPTYESDGVNRPPKNIILLIADGMGMAQLQAAFTANRGDLTTFKIKHTGWVLTSSSDSYITDSAPSATAYSSGSKSNNRAVGVDPFGKPLKLLPDYLAEMGKSSAIITAGDITDATPAAFYAHQSERTDAIAILSDIKQASFSILMGAGSKKIDSFLNSNQPFNNKLVVTDTLAGKPAAFGRGDWLKQQLLKNIDRLKSNKKGFFIMAEGAQVDYGGHQNQLPYIVSEVLDFDLLVSAALAYADQDKETLVVVTADHETGGLTLLDGNIVKGYISGHFSTDDHTAVPVPVLAYGPMSFLFSGVYQNNDIFNKLMKAVKK